LVIKIDNDEQYVQVVIQRNVGWKEVLKGVASRNCGIFALLMSYLRKIYSLNQSSQHATMDPKHQYLQQVNADPARKPWIHMIGPFWAYCNVPRPIYYPHKRSCYQSTLVKQSIGSLDSIQRLDRERRYQIDIRLQHAPTQQLLPNQCIFTMT
jgi:hypothetical protein